MNKDDVVFTGTSGMVVVNVKARTKTLKFIKYLKTVRFKSNGNKDSSQRGR